MASARLSKTFGTATSQKIGTISFWFKLGKYGSNGGQPNFFSTYENDNNRTIMKLNGDDQFEFQARSGGNVDLRFDTNRELRDINAWYHLVITTDTTQSTAGDRCKIYINGVQQTSFATSTIPNQNVQPHYLYNNMTKMIGAYNNGPANYFDGQMAHFHMTDGTAYPASTFGETDATTGIWKPKTDPGISQANYGNNGFFLKFDNSANMGLDSSGNSNNLTVNGTIIQTKDTPNNVFCTNNSLWSQESTRILTFTNINNMISGGGSSTWYQTPGTLAFSKGKYYWECKFNASTNLDKNTPGVIDYKKTTESGQFQDKAGSVFYKNEDGGETRLDGSTSSADYGTLAQNDILGVAVDMDAGTPTVKFYKNGSLLATVNASSLAGKSVTPAHMIYTSGEYQVNYGNGYFGTTAVSSAQNPDDGIGIFEYSVPSGYKALCTKSINAQEYS